MKRSLCLLLFMAASAWAQPQSVWTVTFANPSGLACQSSQAVLYATTGALYTCQSGIFAIASGGGSAFIGAAGTIQTTDGSGNPVDPGATAAGGIGSFPNGLQTGGTGSGIVAMSGATSGSVTQTVAAIAGSWTFTWPIAPCAAHQWWTTDTGGVGSCASIVAADLPATAVTPAAYTNASITVDQQGRITAAASGASSTDDEINPTVTYQREHFTTGLATNGNIGQTGLNLNNVGAAPTVAYVAVAGHPGVLRFTTTGVSGQGGTLAFSQGVSGGPVDAAIWSAKDWDVYFVVTPGSNSTGITSNILNLGLQNTTTSVAASGAWRLRYDTSLGTPDPHLMFQVCNASGANGCASVTVGTDTGSSLVDSGITPVAGTWYQIHIWRRLVGVSGNPTVYMSINGAVVAPGYKTFCSSGCDGVLTHEYTSGGISVQALYVTNTSAARSLDIDYMAYSITGLQLY